MSRFRDSKEFGPTLDSAAERLGISATAVEKDYWVSQVLGVLARDFGQDFIFKGGTSLSKGYGIVERFSEDIDVLVLPGERGRGATDTLMKQMSSRAAAGIGGSASPVARSETGRHRSYEVTYPATREATALLRTSVLLEMGVRGGAHPHKLIPISCLLGDVLKAEGINLGEFPDLEPFEAVVLHPGRTLLEKLVNVHAVAQQLSNDADHLPDRRSGRHFYDIYQLLGDERVRELLAERAQIEAVMTSIDEVTRTHFGGSGDTELRPEGGFAASPAFHPGSSVSRRLRVAYEATMPELYFGAVALPAWDAICGRVSEFRALL